MSEPGSGGWVAEHWESAIAGVAALGMLARELWRMRDERAKRIREDAKEHRDEGEGIFQRALTLLRETEDRYRRSEGQLEALRAERDKFEAMAEALAARIARYGIAKLGEELSNPDPSILLALDGMPVAFVVTRFDSGRFLVANASFCAILGRTSAEVLAGSWQDWIAPEDRDRTAGVESLALDRPVEIENVYLRPDGSRVRLHWTASRYRQISVSWCEEVGG